MQLLNEIFQIFKLKKLTLWLKTYEILATGPNCGLIECINDSMSIDEIHKNTNGEGLYQFYKKNFGGGHKKSKGFKKAQSAFCYSLAAYSLVCYIL
jgi:phosphatidylinositol 4-kinase